MLTHTEQKIKYVSAFCTKIPFNPLNTT
ncbi:uncharacterized protein METZ01_LOCUS489182, partial [marine metagenome]